MSVTINNLYNQLWKLRDEGYGKQKVCIDKKTFKHPLEQDGVSILDVENVEIEIINIADGDGCTKTRKDGTECYNHICVLKGE